MRYLSTLQFYNSSYIGTYVDGGIEEDDNIFKQLIDEWDEPATIVDILNATGRAVPTHDLEYYSYTNSSLFTKLVVNGNQSNITAGSTGTIVVDDASSAKAGDMVFMPDGSACRIQSISTNTLTVYAIDTITLAAADNFELAVPYNTIGEGSSAPDEASTSINKRSNQLNVIETAVTITDFRKAARTIVDFGPGKAYFEKDQHDTWRKHMAKIGFAYLMGKKATFDDPDDTGTGKIVTGRGLDDEIVNNGGFSSQAQNAASNSYNMDLTDWKNFNRTLTQRRSPSEGFFWCGWDMGAAIDDLFREELAGGALVYNAFGKGNGKQRAIDLGVDSFKIYGRTFHKSVLLSMNHPNVTGAAGHLFKDYGYYVPATMERNPGTGERQEKVRSRYLKIDDGMGQDRFREKLLGGLAPFPTDKANVLEVRYTSYENIELLGQRHFGRLQLAA